MIIVRNGKDIRTMDQWLASMPPRIRERQWKEGRSAMELARAWVGTGEISTPEDLTSLLESHPQWTDVELLEGRPEEETALDEFRGASRNADMLLIGERAEARVVISVEAKADESFGPAIGEYLTEKLKNERSNAPARIRNLTAAIFGTDPEEVSGLRYQLLHATAGTLIAADQHGADQCLFLVHAFHGATDPVKVERNEADLRAFVRKFGWEREFDPGMIVGPFSVPGGGRVPGDLDLYVGEVAS